MKALSILQPYAWLIVTGRKDIENRVWYTGFRGPVLIHAGKTYGKRDHAEDAENIEGYPQTREEMIVGIATITGCVDRSDSKWFSGPWGFTLADARALPKLIPMRGALGFFDVPPDVLAQLPQEWLS